VQAAASEAGRPCAGTRGAEAARARRIEARAIPSLTLTRGVWWAESDISSRAQRPPATTSKRGLGPFPAGSSFFVPGRVGGGAAQAGRRPWRSISGRASVPRNFP
jgi:hypothetical protein